MILKYNYKTFIKEYKKLYLLLFHTKMYEINKITKGRLEMKLIDMRETSIETKFSVI